MSRTCSLAALAALGLAGCALSAGDGGDNGDDGGDDTPPCDVVLELEPADAVAPVMLTATAIFVGTSVGPMEFTWDVAGPAGATITPRPDSGTLRKADVLAGEPGSYTVFVNVAVNGYTCDAQRTVQVLAPGANTLPLRLRFTPRAEHGVPPQDDATPLVVHGGADLTLEAPRDLAAGVAVSGVMLGPGGTGLPAQLAITPTAGGRTIDLYSDATGAFSGRILGNQTHRVMVVPYDYALAPSTLAMQTAGEIAAGWTFDAGEVVSGTALDAGGNPVAFAWVSVSTGDLPPTLAQTAMDGSFSARARTGAAPLRVRVAPATGAHTAISAASPAEVPAGGTTLALVVPSAPPVDVAVHVAAAGGGNLGGARVTFVADASEGGSLVVGGGAPITATRSTRRTVTVDAAGNASLQLPAGDYTAIVEPPAGAAGQAVSAVPYSAVAGPLELAAAAPQPFELHVQDPEGGLVAGARVTFVAQGRAGVGAGVTLAATSDDVAGAVAVGLAGGMPYEVVIEPPAGSGLARQRVAVVGGASLAKPLVVGLPRGLTIRGEVNLPGVGGRSGIRVAAHCDGCATPEVILGETITTAGGRFILVVPDPGVSP